MIDPSRFRGLTLAGSPADTPRYDPLLHVVAMLRRRSLHLTRHGGYVGDTAVRWLWYLDVIERIRQRG
jgi:hypothetical protein